MTAQTKLLWFIMILAVAIVGVYAVRVLPPILSSTPDTTLTDQLTVVRVLPSDPVRGARNAAKTIIEFGDLECPVCGALDPQLKDLIKQNSGVRLVWKDCPSSTHPNAEAAAEAALCAGDQGKYWQYHDLLIQNQDQLGPDLYPTLAATLKLNATVFASCLTSGIKNTQILSTTAECAEAGVADLPAFFVNGKPFSGANADIIHELTVELSK